MSRIYLAGDDSGVPKVAWVDLDTLSLTQLPAIGSETGELRSIAVVAIDDVWVGWFRGTSTHPKFGHWDGISWTIHECTGYSDANASVTDIYVVSANEIYATVYPYRIAKWNGSSWVIHAYSTGVFINDSTTIMRGSTGSDMWLSGVGGKETVAHWNGSSFDPKEQPGADFETTTGIVTYKGDIYVASGDRHLYKRTGFDTWVSVFSIPWEFEPQNFQALWVDTEEDILWGGYAYNAGSIYYGAFRWDGTTLDLYPNTAYSTASISQIVGVMNGNGEDAGIYYTGPTDSLDVRESDGTWSHNSIYGTVDYWAIDAYQSPIQYPPVLQNQDPAPSSTDNAVDKEVYLEIYDQNEDLDLSTVDIYIDGNLVWTNEAPVSGYSGRTKLVTVGAQGYWINQWDYWDLNWHTVRVVADDSLSNTLDDTYIFSVSGIVYARIQWGEVLNCLNAPVLQNQNPAPYSNGSSQNNPLYLEVVDADSDLIAGSVIIYINGVMAWSNDAIESGFSGSKVAVSQGFGYSLFPIDGYGREIVIVRVLASDERSNTLDESYYFYIAYIVTRESDVEYIAFDFPMQFSSNADISRTTLEMSVENNLRSSVLIRLGSIPLNTDLGSIIPILPFDPNDIVTESIAKEEILRAVAIGEPRAFVDSSVSIEREDNQLKLIMPYSIPSRVKEKSKKLSLPVQKLDEG